MQHQPNVVLEEKEETKSVPPLHKGCTKLIHGLFTHILLPNTHIQQCHLRVILPKHKQHEVAGTVQEAQGCGQLAAGKAVQGQVHLWVG